MDQARSAAEETRLQQSVAFMERQTKILESIASGASPSQCLEAMAELVETTLTGTSCVITLSVENMSFRGMGPRFSESPSPADTNPPGASPGAGTRAEGEADPGGRGLRVVPVMVDGRVAGEVFVVFHPERAMTDEEEVVLRQTAHLGSVAAQRERSAARLAHEATHDALTGLSNRALFHDRLKGALLREQRSGTGTAVLFLDIDRFKVINDSLGHSAGDALLQLVAQRLLAVIRPEDTLARFGGDEFAILCEGLSSSHEAVALAERLVSSFSIAHKLGSQEVFLTASIGIAINDGSLDSPELLIRDADAAMYKAKHAGRGRVKVFERATRPSLSLQLETENAFREAVTHQGITVLYQPLIRLSDERVVGVEALARWPGRPDIGPTDFVAMAEDMGLVAALGRTVLEDCELGPLRVEEPDRGRRVLCGGESLPPPPS